jgi:methylated-DNA-[protein]-cysteine S-methyltransferase
MNDKTYFDTLNSPIGDLLLTSDGSALTGLYMDAGKHGPAMQSGWKRDPGVFKVARAQLKAYFAGELQDFDVPLAAEGTEFQRKVWATLREIPYGVTWSYVQLAERIGNPKASRAVGLANGRNPISIIVPCHRVIGANGSLTGYGGGLPRKKWLLAHEAGDSGALFAP